MLQLLYGQQPSEEVCPVDQMGIGRIALNMSAVPLSLGLLRYLSSVESMGVLVLTVFAMIADLG